MMQAGKEGGIALQLLAGISSHEAEVESTLRPHRQAFSHTVVPDPPHNGKVRLYCLP